MKNLPRIDLSFSQIPHIFSKLNLTKLTVFNGFTLPGSHIINRYACSLFHLHDAVGPSSCVFGCLSPHSLKGQCWPIALTMAHRFKEYTGTLEYLSWSAGGRILTIF